MRLFKLLNFLDKNKTFIVLTVLTIISILIGIYNETFPLWYVLCILVFFFVFSIWDRYEDYEGKEELNSNVGIIKEDGKETKVNLQKVLESEKEQKKMLTIIKEEKTVSIRILDDLINRGAIEYEELYNHMPVSDIYCLYCFPAPYYSIKYGKAKYNGPGKRLYPEILKEIGFVRISRFSTAYVTTPRRLIKKFRNINYLREYLAVKIDKAIKKEYEEYLIGLKRKKKSYFKQQYNILRNTPYSQKMPFSIAIIRGKLDERNIKHLYGVKTYSAEFANLLKEEIDFRYVDLPRNKLITIKNILFDLSLSFFLYDINAEDLEIIKQLEPELKEELKIKKFTDYLNSLNVLMEKFKVKFGGEKTKEYITIFEKRIKQNLEEIKKLGINI